MTNGAVNHKMLFRLAYTMFSALVLSVIGLLFVYLYPFEPVKYEKVVMTQDKVAAGEALSYEIYFQKFVDKTGSMTRYQA